MKEDSNIVAHNEEKEQEEEESLGYLMLEVAKKSGQISIVALLAKII